jgi:hypothetical protein
LRQDQLAASESSIGRFQALPGAGETLSIHHPKVNLTMSTTTPTVQPSPIPPPTPPDQREIRVYSHSALFYWWPVWFVGFLMAGITYLDGYVMLLVPDKTRVEGRNVILPQGKEFPKDATGGAPRDPHIYMARSKNLGVLFAAVLLVIVVISNVPLHGLWSLLVLLFIVLLVVIFALIKVDERSLWELILDKLSYLDIHINLGGYLFISLVLFIIWVVTVMIFDHRKYVAVTPGQVRVCQAIGTGEEVYDTSGMTFAKRQDDLFRHWIVGLGSGDLIIHRPNTKDIDMPNVLFIGSKIKEMERLIREKQVV